MANLGCIEINPWNSTIKNAENPDWLVIDINPENDNFEEVVQTALIVKDVMDELESDCYCKTSGATGLHVYIPLGAKYNYNQVKILAELLAIEIQQRLPEITSLERSIKKRNHKIYVDYLQNRRGQTLAAAYAVRPVLNEGTKTDLPKKDDDDQKETEVNSPPQPAEEHLITEADDLQNNDVDPETSSYEDTEQGPEEIDPVSRRRKFKYIAP